VVVTPCSFHFSSRRSDTIKTVIVQMQSTRMLD
jgi:hypothetical protein